MFVLPSKDRFCMQRQARIDPLRSFRIQQAKTRMQRLLLLMAAAGTTDHHLIADIQSTETVAISNGCFQVSSSPSLSGCSQDVRSPLSRPAHRCCRP